MKLYSTHFNVEFTKNILIVSMCVEFSPKQVEFLAKNRRQQQETWDFITARMRQAVLAADSNAVFNHVLNLENPITEDGKRRSEIFGSFRATVRTEWGYPAIFAAFNRASKLVTAHAKLSGYNPNNTRRRNPVGGTYLVSGVHRDIDDLDKEIDD